MKMRFIIASALMILLFNPLGSQGQETKNTGDLKAYIENARHLFEVPGIAVAIIKNGKIEMNEGFGLRNANSGEGVDPQTIFGIASCSKALTAACLAIMVEDSALQWDDRVTSHYPQFRLSDPYITNEMMVQDLLCHRSGLETFDGDLLWYGSDYSRKEIMERIAHREISYSFRSQFGYQNVMYIAAGEVIREVTGKTWDEFIDERIFTPLQMESTSTTNSHFDEKMNLAYPHVDGKPVEFLKYDNCGPAASINSSTEDLMKWVALLLNKGKLDEKQLFTPNQYYKMTSPHTLLNAGQGEKIGGTHFYTYGLGWFIFDYEGRKVIQHGGGLPGFHSKVVLVPEDNLGYVILANQISGLVEAVYKKILDFYLSDSEEDWANIYHSNEIRNERKEEAKEEKRIEDRVEGTKPSLDPTAYAGEYEDKMYGKARIENDKGKLSLTMVPSGKLFSSDLEHWEKDTFKITFNDPFLPAGYVTFHSEDGTGIHRFTIDLENPDFHFYKLNFLKIE